MKNLFSITGAILLTTALAAVFFLLNNAPAKKAEILPSPAASTTSNPTTTEAVRLTPLPTISAKTHILDQVRQLAAEYEQAVQAEKKNGEVEYSKDPDSGEEIFICNNEAMARVTNSYEKFNDKLNELNRLYVQLYRDETGPTPFPSQTSPEQGKAYLEILYEQAQQYCPTQEIEAKDAVVMVYDPMSGKYHAIVMNDATSQCEVYGQMLAEWRSAPMLAKINQGADMASIRQITGQHQLVLKYQTITPLANAPWQNSALYVDETGTQYYVDIDSARLAQIVPNFPSHPSIPAAKEKSVDLLRGMAEQFALTNSSRLAELKSGLVYEENRKGDFFFFTWSYRNKDWSGTDWAMMAPFLQIGILADGQIATYVNTLDLFK